MDWVHCNTCYIQPGGTPKTNFNVTSCGHIFCVICEPNEINNCKVCKNKCTMTLINSQMPKEVSEYFQDSHAMFNKVLKIMEFQKGHRLRLCETLRFTAMKYQNAKVEIIRLQEETVALKK
uniref:RING-type domain-containing protein n=1 Tax=Clastoptera arizonana TaxID=38151 RepID=A0A1B6D4S8_9HEMI